MSEHAAIEWERVIAPFSRITARLDGAPWLRAEADEVGAYARDRLDRVGIHLYDERDLFVLIATTELLVDMAHNAARQHRIPQPARRAIDNVATVLLAGIADYLPDRAR